MSNFCTICESEKHTTGEHRQANIECDGEIKSELIKWKCHNCNNIFESKDEQDLIEETRQHLADCMDISEFIEVLK